MSKTRRVPVEKRTPRPVKTHVRGRRCVSCREEYPLSELNPTVDGLVCEGCFDGADS